MAEHDAADRGDRDEREVPRGDEQSVPFDEDAAWQAIVAGYGEEPPDPPGAKPFKSVEDLALLEAGTNDTDGGGAGGGPDTADPPDKADKTDKSQKADRGGPGRGDDGSARPLGSSVAFAPGVGGPRDHTVPEPSDSDFDEDDEGHFVPPEPPPLPAADTTAKFAWLGVIGGPVVLLLAVLLGWEMEWWLATVGIGGFLGGFVTLVARMRTDDDEDDDPGRGAVV
ncbi:hypothetical protein ACFY93_19660 [Streptomyces sp. NPDC008313]|uniref:hypothetical protein n=1 Tax=Streptomyces sp. NPDC008313 TaxID=3364826 RepID=UPI0036EDE470